MVNEVNLPLEQVKDLVMHFLFGTLKPPCEDYCRPDELIISWVEYSKCRNPKLDTCHRLVIAYKDIRRLRQILLSFGDKDIPELLPFVRFWKSHMRSLEMERGPAGKLVENELKEYGSDYFNKHYLQNVIIPPEDMS